MGVTINSRVTTNALASSGSTPYLNGNVGDWQETTINFSVVTSFKTSLSVTVTVNTDDTLTLSSGNWEDYGFEVGDAVTGTLNQTQTSSGTNTDTAISETITAIAGNVMTLSGTIFATIPVSYIVGGSAWGYTLNWLELIADKTFTAVEFNYNQFLNSNYNSPTLNSFLDSSTTTWIASGLDATDTVTVVDMTPQSPRSGTTVDSVTIVGDGKVSGVSTFEIVMVHSISGIYEQTTDIQTPTNPSWFTGTEQITDTFQVIAQVTSGSPDGALTSALTKNQGNTGWFNENKNSSTNIFAIDSVVYTDTATTDVVTGLQSDAETTVEITITTGSAFFVELDNLFSAGIVTLPIDRTSYAGSNHTDLENLCANTMGVNQSYNFGTAVTSTINGFQNSSGAGVDINRYHFEFISTTEVVITLDVEPNAAFTTYVNSLPSGDRLFAIWVSCVDSTKIFALANRVNVMTSGQWLEAFIPPSSLEGGVSIFPRELDFYASSGSSNDIVVEDDFHGAMNFVLNKDIRISSVVCGVEIYNSVTEERTTLDSITVDTSTAPISADGTQEVNFEINRPFNYVDGFKDKLISVIRNTSGDSGDNRGFTVAAAMRFRWEWWLSNITLPTSFYDNTEPLDNLNYEFISKLLSGDYTFRYFQEIYTDVIDYINTQDLTLHTYNNAEDDGFVSTINIYDDAAFSGSLYLGLKTNKYEGREFAMVGGQLNYLEAKLEKASMTFAYDYVEVTIEGEDGAGYLSQWKLRSDQTPDGLNPLRPLSGETTVKVDQSTPTELVVQCAINPDLLPTNITNVKITVEYCGTSTGEGVTDYLTRDIAWASIDDEPTVGDDEFTSNECEYTLPVFADLNNENDNYKNDIKALLGKKSNLVTNREWFLVDCDGNEYALNDNTYGTYFPFGSFQYEPDVSAYQLRWYDVLDLLGEGCYSFKTTITLFRSATLDIYSCKYNLQQFTYSAAFRTVRVESVQNGYHESSGINYKGLNWVDHLRFEGYFGYQQPIHESTMYVGTNNQKKTNQIDLTSEYTLTSQLVPHICVTKPLWEYHLMASELFISDYNTDNHRRDYISFPVYLEEVNDVDYFKLNSKAVMSIKFTERNIPKRMRTCVGDRPLPYLSPDYVYTDQCPIDPRSTKIRGLFSAGVDGSDALSIITIVSGMEGTYTAITDDGSSGTLGVKVNGIALISPFVPFDLEIGDTLQVTRSDDTLDGYYEINGTYI